MPDRISGGQDYCFDGNALLRCPPSCLRKIRGVAGYKAGVLIAFLVLFQIPRLRAKEKKDLAEHSKRSNETNRKRKETNEKKKGVSVNMCTKKI